MKTLNAMLNGAIVLVVLLLAGCGHKLVPHGGESTVSVFRTKADFDNVQSMKSKGGPEGMIGGLGESFVTTKVPADTPVKVISTQDNSEEIEVSDGPNKGLHGFVAKDDVD